MRICLVFLLLLMTMVVGGCIATPSLVMESGFQRKIITPCDNDILCFRHTYDVTWDAGCREYSGRPSKGYPVSYRSNEYVWETGSYGYAVTLPAGGAARIIDNGQNQIQ